MNYLILIGQLLVAMLICYKCFHTNKKYKIERDNDPLNTNKSNDWYQKNGNN